MIKVEARSGLRSDTLLLKLERSCYKVPGHLALALEFLAVAGLFSLFVPCLPRELHQMSASAYQSLAPCQALMHRPANTVHPSWP